MKKQVSPPKRLIEQTKAILRLRDFLKNEVGLKVELSARDLREILSCIETKAKQKRKLALNNR
jgi:hypothetical protein